MPSSYWGPLVKPLEWATRGKGSLEVAAVGAGFFTVHWLIRRFSEKPASEEEPTEAEEEEEENADTRVETLKHEEFQARRWDSDAFYRTDYGLHPLDRVTSFRLPLQGSEISATDAETMSYVPSLALGDASTTSSISLSIPEFGSVMQTM